MSTFGAFLQLGWEHILDPGGYDHLLFLVALLALYTYRDWRAVLILVTAFTLGHSLTLLLNGLAGPVLPAEWVEFLIPLTILFTAAGNLWRLRQADSAPGPLLRYGMAAAFGLIHGMGFSLFFRSLLGEDAPLLQPLLAFNLGIELGQLAFVAVLLLLQEAVLRFTCLGPRTWQLYLSVLAALAALHLLIETFPY